jgi:peptide/nickel transport system substrate-binding protein
VNFPKAFTTQIGVVMAPESLAADGPERANNPIGTGPFVFDEWVPDGHLRVTRNPDYWRGGLPYLDGIEFRPIPDHTARRDALRSGELDVAEQNSQGRPALDELENEGLTVIDDVDNVGSGLLLMNGDVAPLDDQDVRRAVVSAIDREAYRDTVYDWSFEVADQPYPEASRWHTDVDYPPFDVDRARALVEDHEAEQGPIRLDMMTVNGGSLEGPLFLQQALGDAGIEVEILDLELAAYIQRLVAGDYDLVSLGSFFGAADPDGSYAFLHSSGADPDTLIKLNFARYRNPAVDDALEAQRRTDDPDLRQAAWAEVWQTLAEDLPFAFLQHDRYALATKQEVRGFVGPTTPEGTALPALNRWTPFFTEVFVLPD